MRAAFDFFLLTYKPDEKNLPFTYLLFRSKIAALCIEIMFKNTLFVDNLHLLTKLHAFNDQDYPFQ